MTDPTIDTKHIEWELIGYVEPSFCDPFSCRGHRRPNWENWKAIYQRKCKHIHVANLSIRGKHIHTAFTDTGLSDKHKHIKYALAVSLYFANPTAINSLIVVYTNVFTCIQCYKWWCKRTVGEVKKVEWPTHFGSSRMCEHVFDINVSDYPDSHRLHTYYIV